MGDHLALAAMPGGADAVEQVGALLGGGDEKQLAALSRFGGAAGLAFQVADDILDVTASTEDLGKTAAKDLDADKTTYVKLLGLQGAKEESRRLLQEALKALESFGESADLLRDLAIYIVEHDH